MLLSVSKLHSLATSVAAPASSSAGENGCPTNRASFLTPSTGSRSISSYLRNSTASGFALLAFHYPRRWSQIGPLMLVPLHAASNSSAKEMSGASFLAKWNMETIMSLGSLHM